MDAENALIVAQSVDLDAADSRQWLPMIDAAAKALEVPTFHVAANAGYSNVKQAAECEARGFELHILAARAVHTSSGGAFYSREHFRYQPDFRYVPLSCWKTLKRKRTRPKELDIVYRASAENCSACHLNHTCKRTLLPLQ